MTSILDIPEIQALDGPASLIRIPNQIDVPVTPRLMRIIDTPQFQRLTRISQLGMVCFVYPAANHNRFEHSLGVYRNSLLFLRQFAKQPRFAEAISAHHAKLLILAALLHDIGHWPYCHPIEDIELEGLPSHEEFANQYISSGEIANCLKEDWNVEPEEVLEIINKAKGSVSQAILSSILSGPIDIDKMDYLYRDSLHAGVPYGQNFDSLRLIRSLCLNKTGDRLAITQKGRTAAELMVFARYVMFSEVYWHHAVRSATAMFQRAFYLWFQQAAPLPGSPAAPGAPTTTSDATNLFELSEFEMVDQLKQQCQGTPAGKLLEQLFGPTRKLYKRVASYSFNEDEDVYRAIAQKPYAWLVQFSAKLTQLLSQQIGEPVDEHAILVDAPPVGLEVQFDVDVFYERDNSYRKLGEVSPVVNTLARQQFDDFVKQVRIFVDAELLPKISDVDIDGLVRQSVSQ